MYECNRCNFKCLHHFQLIVHRNVHYVNTESAFICEVCYKKCLNSDHLQNHINQHVEDKQLVLLPFQRIILKLKCNDLHSVTPYTCGICSVEFIQENNYIGHVKQHLGLFKCSLCDKNFSCKRNLTEHVQLHTRGNKICAPLHISL